MDCFGNYLNSLFFEYIFIAYIKNRFNVEGVKIGEGNIDINRNKNKITNIADVVADGKFFEIQVKYTNKYNDITFKTDKIKNMLKTNNKLFIVNFYIDDEYNIYFVCKDVNVVLKESKIRIIEGFGDKECGTYNFNKQLKHKIS